MISPATTTLALAPLSQNALRVHVATDREENVDADGAWSRTIDLSGQFHAPLLTERTLAMLIAALLFLPIAIRLVTRRRINTKATKDTKLFVIGSRHC